MTLRKWNRTLEELQVVPRLRGLLPPFWCAGEAQQHGAPVVAVGINKHPKVSPCTDTIAKETVHGSMEYKKWHVSTQVANTNFNWPMNVSDRYCPPIGVVRVNDLSWPSPT